jgi:hypothetical protein
MPEERSLDIDSAWELHLADMILRQRLERDAEAMSRHNS